MEFLEKDLEEIIYNADKMQLSKRGLDINGKLYRQKRIGLYGIADLIHVYRGEQYGLTIEVIELKKERIGISAFLQAIKYIKGIQEYLIDVRQRDISNYFFSIKLIGKSIDDSGSFIYLPDVLTIDPYFEVSFYTYKYSLNGLQFENHSGYFLEKAFENNNYNIEVNKNEGITQKEIFRSIWNTTNEAAKKLGISPSRVRQQIQKYKSNKDYILIEDEGNRNTYKVSDAFIKMLLDSRKSYYEKTLNLLINE